MAARFVRYMESIVSYEFAFLIIFVSLKYRKCFVWGCQLCAGEAGNVQKEDAECFMRKFCDLRAILAGLNESCTGK